MFANYIKVALRNIVKHKGYSFINIAGLAVGMACCILILLWVRHELSYDRFHANADRIYRLAVSANFAGNTFRAPLACYPAALALKQDYPEVVDAVRLDPENRTSVRYQDRQFYEDGIFYADNSIFDVFSFSLISGDPQTALVTAYSVVLTEDAAAKYFGSEDPIGKTLRFDNQRDFSVTGVAKNVPQNSHFSFDMLCSFETQYVENPQRMEAWINHNHYTYLLLADGNDYLQLERKLPALVDAHLGAQLETIGGSLVYFLQPLTDIHLRSHLEAELSGNGNMAYVCLFVAIALFILLIACINFLNLATARFSIRTKEVAVRKTLGAARGRLMLQFLGESLLYSFLALAVALILIEIVMPGFNSLTGKDLRLGYLDTPWFIPAFAGIAFLVGLIGGIYPAFFLSSFRPVRVLKGSIRFGPGQSRFRSALVILQFSISIALIIATIVTYNQLSFMKQKQLGFAKEHAVIIPRLDEMQQQSLRRIKDHLTRIPGVLRAGASTTVPGGNPNIQPFLPEGYAGTDGLLMNSITVDHDFIPAMGMEIVSGRNFSGDLDSDIGGSVIINETAARRFGWDEPVGKNIGVMGDAAGNTIAWEQRKVIGVVRDFHLASLHKKIEPLLIYNDSLGLDILGLRIAGESIPATMNHLRTAWKEIYPERPFDYYFLDQSFDSQYRLDERLSDIILCFSVLAVFIGGLGLYGMSTFAVERRTKEIGVRKVLGSSTIGIALLLSRDFTRYVLVANIFAWPVMYYLMDRWLQDFAYRMSINWGIFVLSGALALVIALLTVSFQALKAALANPINALRHE